MSKNSEWKTKFNEMLSVCQGELKKTTDIGKRMLSASKTNSNLHESYKELGVLVAKAIEEGDITWENPRVHDLLKSIKDGEKDLELMEEEVNNIRFSSESESNQEPEVKK